MRGGAGYVCEPSVKSESSRFIPETQVQSQGTERGSGKQEVRGMRTFRGPRGSAYPRQVLEARVRVRGHAPESGTQKQGRGNNPKSERNRKERRQERGDRDQPTGLAGPGAAGREAGRSPGGGKGGRQQGGRGRPQGPPERIYELPRTPPRGGANRFSDCSRPVCQWGYQPGQAHHCFLGFDFEKF